MSTLGQAYIQILPTTKGIKNNLENELSGQMDSAGQKSSNAFASGFKKKAAKVALAVGAAIGTGVVALTTAAVKNYANYEQLVGGVDTLFGESSKKLQAYAAEAYKTAGISANTYMEQATSFSASLLQSLGGDTAKAADYANRAIIDMADNANKMGTSIESIQNAYQGFAKQNYTMLDNLKLGYGGTKEEMARLIEDASKLTDVQKELGVTVDANDMSFANIVNAISVMQSKMGIAGTTTKEASETISGSLGMAKAAWDNLITGVANPNADLGSLITQFVDSAQIAMANLVPVLTQALSGIVQLVGSIAPLIIAELPNLVAVLVPAVASAFGNIVMALLQCLPQLLDVALQAIVTLANGLTAALPTLIPTVIGIVLQIVDTIVSNLGVVLNAAVALILALAEGIIASLPTLLAQAPVIVQNLTDSLIAAGPALTSATTELMIIMVNGILANLPQIINAAVQIMNTLAAGVIQNIPVLVQAAVNIMNRFISSFSSTDWGSVGTGIINGIANGITSGVSTIISAAKQAALSALKSAKDALDIHSPSKVFRDQVGKMMGEGMALGISDTESDVQKAMEGISNGAVGTISATVNGNASGSYKAVNNGITVGEAQLAGAGGGNITIPVYIGQQKIETIVVSALKRANMKSGGR